jgi:hypothetical protein
VHLVTDVDGRQTSVWLHDVLFTLCFESCIISLSTLVEPGVALSIGKKAVHCHASRTLWLSLSLSGTCTSLMRW